MTSPDHLADTDRASLDAMTAASPELAAVTASARAFAVRMNERPGRNQLEPWTSAAKATGEPALRSCATGLRADQDAVTSGLSLRWSSELSRRPRQPQDAQAADVRTRQPRPARPPRTPRRLARPGRTTVSVPEPRLGRR